MLTWIELPYSSGSRGKNKSWEKDRQQSNEDELTIVSTWCDVTAKIIIAGSCLIN